MKEEGSSAADFVTDVTDVKKKKFFVLIRCPINHINSGNTPDDRSDTVMPFIAQLIAVGKRHCRVRIAGNIKTNLVASELTLPTVRRRQCRLPAINV